MHPAPHVCSLGVGMGLPVPPRTPVPFRALTLPPSTRDATKAGACSPIPKPFGAPGAHQSCRDWQLGTQQPWGHSTPIPSPQPQRSLHPLWARGLSPSAGLTLEHKVVILLGAAHVAPAAARVPPSRCGASGGRGDGPGRHRGRGCGEPRVLPVSARLGRERRGPGSERRPGSERGVRPGVREGSGE